MNRAGRMMGVVVLALGLVSWSAMADDHGGRGNNGNNNGGNNPSANTSAGAGSFESQLIGSAVGQHVGGVPSGGAPWKISVGQVEISSSGHIGVVIRGLLISAGAANNTVGPVTMVDASLVCGDVVAATTMAVPLSTNGNAQIEDTITVPSPCIAPAVLVRVAGTTSGPVANGPFIAVNALAGGSPGNQQNENENDQ